MGRLLEIHGSFTWGVLREEFGNNVRVSTYGNLISALAFLQGASVEDLADKDLLMKRDEYFQIVVCAVVKR